MRIAGVVLAAGLSSRMQRFKPLLPLGGGTVLSMAVETVRKAGVEYVIVVTGRHAAQMADAAKALDAQPVHNPGYERGMFTSVQAGVAALGMDVDAFFLLPVDIPLVRSRTVELLLEDFDAHASAVTHPRFLGERGHPPLIRADLAPAILAHDGTGGLRSVLEAHNADASDVDVADAGTCFDLDVPEDYDKAAARAPRLHIPTADEVRALWDIAHTPDATRAHCRAVAEAARAMAEALRKHKTPSPSACNTGCGNPQTPPAQDIADATAGTHTRNAGEGDAQRRDMNETAAQREASRQTDETTAKGENAKERISGFAPSDMNRPGPMDEHDAALPDADLAEAAALLHDVAKNFRRHEAEGGRLMEHYGFFALADAVAAHRDLDLAPDDPVTEREIVFLADKVVCGTNAVPLDERYGAKLRQWAHDADAVAAITGRRDRARGVYARLEAETGIDLYALVHDAVGTEKCL